MRRDVLRWAAAGATVLMTRPGLAQSDYPARPVTLVVPYAAGGATDVIARMVADRLTKAWPQPVVVANRPGAGTMIGAESVARSAGDGHTLYMTTAAHTISASLYRKLPYDPIRDFAPITLVASIPLVLLAGTGVPVGSVSELVSFVRAKPGTAYASPGNGSPQHLTMELFKSGQSLDIAHVPYKGDAPMMTDLVSGQVPMAFVTLSSALPFIQSGKVKALAIAHERRIDAIRDVPTMAEAGFPGFVSATWFGVLAPASTPAELRKRIYQDVSRIVAEPAFTSRLVEMGAEVQNLAPDDFAALIRAEVKRWHQAVQASGAQVD